MPSRGRTVCGVTTHLTPLDAAFLELEQTDESAHMHIGWAMIFDPLPEGGAPSLEVLREPDGGAARAAAPFPPPSLLAAGRQLLPADLGAGPRLRHRDPHAPRDSAGAGRRGRAARVARRLLLPPPRPRPSALGDDPPRRARRRPLGARDEGAPLPGRRDQRRLGDERASRRRARSAPRLEGPRSGSGAAAPRTRRPSAARCRSSTARWAAASTPRCIRASSPRPCPGPGRWPR